MRNYRIRSNIWNFICGGVGIANPSFSQLEACYWRCVHALAQYTIMAVTSGTAEIGYLVANLPEFTYLSKYLHFLRETHIHFQLAVGIRILCAKLASVDVRLYRYGSSRTWFSAVFYRLSHATTSEVDEVALRRKSTVTTSMKPRDSV